MYVQKMEQEKVAKDRGETKDNRSFLAKYVSLPMFSSSPTTTYGYFIKIIYLVHSLKIFFFKERFKKKILFVISTILMNN